MTTTETRPVAVAATRVLTIDVEGLPIPQGSKSARVQGRRAVIYDDNAALLKPWREKVEAAARARVALTGWVMLPLQEPCRVDIIAFMPKPPSVRRDLPAVKPDWDKLARAIGDSLTDARVYADDGQVVDGRLRKVYAPAGSPVGARIVVSGVRGSGVALSSGGGS